MANKHWNKHSTSLTIKERPKETTARYYFTNFKMAKIEKTVNTKSWHDCGATGIFICCWWEYEVVERIRKTGRNMFLPK